MSVVDTPARREDIRIGEVAAWWYRPSGAAGAGARAGCVVMAHGFSLTRHDGLPAFAEAFAAAGLHVLLFDHRHLGDSGPPRPRQRFRAAEQRADWANVVAHARTLEGVDPARIVLWGYSFSGGHVVRQLIHRADVAAGLVLCPFVDGPQRVLATPPSLIAWILPRALRDLAGSHNLIPVTGPPGSRAAMTLPGEADGFAAAVPEGSPWRNEISPGLFVTVGLERPVAQARHVRAPLWVGVGERDISTHGPSVERLAKDAPLGELHRYPYDHFEPFLGEAPARIAADQVEFLQRIGLA
ncbi:Quorum-quenching protein AidA [Paraconexibacter sp. AEG42_29]|uniref:Quorum-quenching protein AidA n=1 Tax=Paraconexibacter sp. AEG42_29 TaxID=2997339 RepID=A0AAU7B188_9ACTN